MLHILELSPSIAPAPQVFTHIVTLVNHSTGDEQVLRIETLSDRFCDVIREVMFRKAQLKLRGYEVWEALSCTDVF